MYTNKQELLSWNLEIQRRNIYDEILGYFERTRGKHSPSYLKSRGNFLPLFRDEVNADILKSWSSTNKIVENIEACDSDFRLLDRGKSSSQVLPKNKLKIKTVEKDRVHYSSSKTRSHNVDSAHGEYDMRYSQRSEDEEVREDVLQNLMKELEELNVLEAEMKGQKNTVSAGETTKRKNIYHKLFADFEKRERKRSVAEKSRSKTNNLQNLHDHLNIECERHLQKSDLELPIMKKDTEGPVVSRRGYLCHRESIQSFLEELPKHEVSVKTEFVDNELFYSRKGQELLNTTSGVHAQQFTPNRVSELDSVKLDGGSIITFENKITKEKSINEVSFSEFTKLLEETNISRDIKNEVPFLLKKHDFLDISVEKAFQNEIENIPDLSEYNEDLEKGEAVDIQLKLIDLDVSDTSCSPNLQHCEETKFCDSSTVNKSWRSEMINNDRMFLDMAAISAKYQSLYEQSKKSGKNNHFHRIKDDLITTQLCPKIGLDLTEVKLKKSAIPRYQSKKKSIFSRVRHLHSLDTNSRTHLIRDSRIRFMEEEINKLVIDKEFELSSSSLSESGESGDESYKEKSNLPLHSNNFLEKQKTLHKRKFATQQLEKPSYLI